VYRGRLWLPFQGLKNMTTPSVSDTALRPQKSFAAAFIVLTLALAGCASGIGANDYRYSQVGAVARVEEGTVVASRPIIVEGNSKPGTLAGAVVGGLVGSQFGGGRDEQAIGAVIGAVAGGAAGNAMGKSATSQHGVAYTVRLRSGELVSITQGGEYVIANGTPVLIEYGERARVIPQNVSIGY
jgi:outer membrane lipoprotein SlyB